MLIFYQNNNETTKVEIDSISSIEAKKTKTKCCKKFKKNNRCKQCPHYSLIQ